MAVTATVSVVGPGGNTGNVIINQNLQALFTITNTNSTGQNIQEIAPYARVTGSQNNLNAGCANMGDFNIGPNAPIYVPPNGGTLTVAVPLTFTQSSSFPIVPTTSINSSTQNNSVNSNNTYDVGATIIFTDANTPTTLTVVSPTATTVTVNTVALPCSN